MTLQKKPSRERFANEGRSTIGTDQLIGLVLILVFAGVALILVENRLHQLADRIGRQSEELVDEREIRRELEVRLTDLVADTQRLFYHLEEKDIEVSGTLRRAMERSETETQTNRALLEELNERMAAFSAGLHNLTERQEELTRSWRAMREEGRAEVLKEREVLSRLVSEVADLKEDFELRGSMLAKVEDSLDAFREDIDRLRTDYLNNLERLQVDSLQKIPDLELTLREMVSRVERIREEVDRLKMRTEF